jgi:protein-disulfide isomerase
VDQPKTFAVDSAARLAARKAPRLLQLHEGEFTLDLHDVPLLGSADAPCVLVHLFDYSCPHCRALHPMLVDLQRQMSNQVAIASLLVPLATNCNPYVKRVMPLHTNACDYARAGLAVWRSEPAKLPAFEEWIFASNRPPTPEAVRAHAMQMVGTNQFEQALRDPWIKAHLDRNISLYATNYYRFKKSVLPELMIGTNIVSGAVRNRDELYGLVTNQFRLSVPGK